MKSLKVIKIGGKVIDDDQKLDHFLNDFASVKGPKILIHGGGSIATKMGERLGIKPNMIDGRRITDAETLEVITMVYGGLVNKNIVAKLHSLGAKAVGLSGADLNIIPAKKRNPKPVDFGWVGDVETIHTEWLSQFLDNEVVPVLAPLTHDQNGHILNTNADTIASSVATALSKDFETELLFCFEQPGVMNDGKLITKMNLLLYRYLKDGGIITDGMIPKLDLGFSALRKGVKVSIRSFEDVAKTESGTRLVK
ncbi:acetylglutamate kinase [Gracilimonas sediminicola]|uniref:Acetylglutamate kinase n=1 Tax=Gracilimonas sediminicola TaxID=2952158 RepID=A0A9X2L3D5_9BACT|nr:acetylglutamate kinase [Gracilimonas sediminicola]